MCYLSNYIDDKLGGGVESRTNANQSQTAERLNELPDKNTNRGIWRERYEERDVPTGLVNENADVIVTATNKLLAAMSFEDMGLDERFIDALYNVMKYTCPSIIQAQAIPYILAQPRNHLIAQAQNGSGKTVCFALGSLAYVNEEVNHPQVLVLAHTRELVMQITEVFAKLCTYTSIRCTNLLRGCNYDPSAQVVVATTGSLKPSIVDRTFEPHYLHCLVLDEADEMLRNKSFAMDINGIVQLFASYKLECQYLLFSATFDDKVLRFAKKIAPHAVMIQKSASELRLDTVTLFAVEAGGFEEKFRTLNQIYSVMDVGQTCIFVNFRETADRLGNALREHGHTVGVIRGGDMPTDERERILKSFRQGETKVLVSTDILARGIDVLDVTLVINFDIPYRNEDVDYDTFLHRSGRTGRMGRKGASITLMTHEVGDLRFIRMIEAHFSMPIHIVTLDNLEEFEKRIKDCMQYL